MQFTDDIFGVTSFDGIFGRTNTTHLANKPLDLFPILNDTPMLHVWYIYLRFTEMSGKCW